MRGVEDLGEADTAGCISRSRSVLGFLVTGISFVGQVSE